MTTEESALLRKIYGLRENPFMVSFGVTRPEYYVGRDSQKAAWTRVIDHRKGKVRSSINFIVGEYGYGKTFSLYMILEQYRRDANMLSIYMKLLREDATTKFGADFIQRLFSHVSVSEIDLRKAKRALSSVPPVLEQHASVLAKWFDGDQLAYLLLSGKEKLAKADLAQLGVRQAINSTDVAKDYLITFLYALRESGKHTVLLCIDEVEYLFSQMKGPRVANVFNALRDICDLPTSPEVAQLGISISNIIFFFGISQSGWTNLTNLEKRESRQGGPIQPLRDRFEKIIELTSLSPKETEILIRARLSYNRISGRFEGEPLIPYTRDFVEYVYQLTLGNPRKIIERCEYTLVDGLEQQVPKLTRTFAKRVFESHGLLTEPDTTTLVGISKASSRKKPRKAKAK